MAAPIVGILGQVAPAAATPGTLLAAVGTGRRVIGSTVVFAETGGAAAKVRVWARKAGAAAAVGNAIAYDTGLDANSHNGLTEGLTFAATDIVTVQSDTGNVTFTFFGIEEDAV